MDRVDLLRQLEAPVKALDEAAQTMELADSEDPAVADVGRIINDLTVRLESAIKSAQGNNGRYLRVREALEAKGYELLATWNGPNQTSRMHYFSSLDPDLPPRMVMERINRGIGAESVGVEVFGPLTEGNDLDEVLRLL